MLLASCDLLVIQCIHMPQLPPKPEDSRAAHTASHIMTMAVRKLFPRAARAAGPATSSHSFYQDFLPMGEEISTKHFKKIEKEMRAIIRKDFAVQKREISAEQAKEMFGAEPPKMEILEGILARNEVITVYDFVNENGAAVYTDLCAGPHVERTGQVGVALLESVSAVHANADERQPSHVRLAGVRFATEAERDEYLQNQEEAKKRDHRKLGAQLDLFTFSDLVGSGLPLFTPRGTFVREAIASEINRIQSEYGFQRVGIPHIAKKDLYEKSGHWDKYRTDMFHVRGKSDTEFAIKPMNCPHHAQIFACQPRSYRDLPIRYAETTTCYRDEQPGELLGLSRVRSLTVDDGHVFCRADQILEEVRALSRVIRKFYEKLGMFSGDGFWVSLSVRDPATPEKYLGETTGWDAAEAFLEQVAQEEQLPYRRVEGEAAFYGPKLDFLFQDCLGREWQTATIQIDFVQPERFELEYTDASGQKQRPVMIHRAVAGSLERFLAILLEHFGGALPPFLCPTVAQVLPVAAAHAEYSAEVAAQLPRAEVVGPQESLGKRLRNSALMKVPFVVIVGEQETAARTVTLRRHGLSDDETLPLDQAIGRMKMEA